MALAGEEDTLTTALPLNGSCDAVAATKRPPRKKRRTNAAEEDLTKNVEPPTTAKPRNGKTKEAASSSSSVVAVRKSQRIRKTNTFYHAELGLQEKPRKGKQSHQNQTKAEKINNTIRRNKVTTSSLLFFF